MAPNETRRLFLCEVVCLDIYPHSRIIAVHKFYRSSFGAFLQRHFAELFTKASQQSFLLLALGFVLSSGRHTIANYIWRAGACAFKHFTCFYVFLGSDARRRRRSLAGASGGGWSGGASA